MLRGANGECSRAVRVCFDFSTPEFVEVFLVVFHPVVVKIAEVVLPWLPSRFCACMIPRLRLFFTNFPVSWDFPYPTSHMSLSVFIESGFKLH
ncbi:hypothetical protein CFELI_10880 [Corynebacterium felinum]|uniref:Uncharacterized protein n=1 Tax=Corynebacterium felinum TaxID=131318 RepID=A0ABU2B6F6_9CORY|nr:hypothetical protein [Corynebacterium felinum]WJY95774.1 hypothetical protein CFELI_10880 [Corynebacterium felinum]